MNNTFGAALTTCRRCTRIRHMHFLCWAIAGTCTSPWPQQQAVSPIQQHRMICSKRHISKWTKSFPSANLCKGKLCSQWQWLHNYIWKLSVKPTRIFVVSWFSVRATRAKHFLSVRVSIMPLYLRFQINCGNDLCYIKGGVSRIFLWWPWRLPFANIPLWTFPRECSLTAVLSPIAPRKHSFAIPDF